MSTAPLESATQQELIDYINTQAAKVHSMQATVDIDTSVGGVKKGKVIDYQQIRGYVLARKPAMLRMIGLLPIVRNRAFDMVSDGQGFKLWIPPKNRFIVGRNDVETHNPERPLENIRPQQIYDALLLREIDPEKEIAVMQNDFEIVPDKKGHRVEQADYEIQVIRKGEHGWFLARKLVFSRTDLLPHREFIYDESGNLATDTRYEDYKDYNGVNFPSQTEIWRPQEEYDITLTIVKLQLNEALPDDKFTLEQPPGAELVHLDQSPANQAPASHAN
ncbi:MAG: outer membrane lipoprotein-sorting protein [Acidobacteriia bacterium]|nr:outer membrane lipoprotein-sorting protein [Terriglobia bacterium]